MLNKIDQKITFIKNMADDIDKGEDKDFCLYQIIKFACDIEDIIYDLKNMRDSL